MWSRLFWLISAIILFGLVCLWGVAQSKATSILSGEMAPIKTPEATIVSGSDQSASAPGFRPRTVADQLKAMQESSTPPLVEGLPALQPREAARSAAQQLSGPTYTEEDVKHFFATHPVPTLPTVGGIPVVTRVKFVTVAEVRAAMGENYGRPDAALLCYVELSGKFAVQTPPRPESQSADTVLMDGASAVFDAVTGNLLSVGSARQLP